MASLAAARKLFDKHLPWSRIVALAAVRRIGSHADGDELRQVAAVKTWDCALAFDPRRWTQKPNGDPFQIFAYPAVWGECIKAGTRGLAGNSKTAQGDHVQMLSIDVQEQFAHQPNQLAVDEAQHSQARHTLIASVLGDLPKRERHVIAEHYLGGMPFCEIAVSLHTSPASISRIHTDGLRLLREALGRRGVNAFRLA